MTATNPFQPFFDMMGAFLPVGLYGGQQFSQSILPGWSLISVNQGNSSAPETEQAVVAKASYGRQLGRIMEALDVVIRTDPPALPDDEEHAGDRKAIARFQDLVADVAKVKKDAAEARAERMIADLQSMEADKHAQFEQLCEALERFLEEARKRRPKP